ncbi:RcnB family protein [Novosphingobium sp. 9U]|uniref:RcnB family protein n=1 Tax=Novosphingobium sp. 9U TaxID=2653158 RepID=UPI0012F2016A|nr:RcnB family protein [Novosphingobium sp. 9U]VWX51420.1 ATP-dependent RNA helicase [Novosphingobium sp. 9U]
MARTFIKRYATSVGALAVVMMALAAPTIASAQDQGQSQGQGQRGGRGDGRGGQGWQNRGDRVKARPQGQGERQWQQRPQAQAQAPAVAQQHAPSAPAARQQGWNGNRNGGWRGEGQQAARGNRNGPDTRGWTPQQWEAYRGAVLEGRDTDAFRNGDNRGGNRQVQREERRDQAQWQGRRDDNRRDARARWQNDRQGNYGRESWRNNGQWRGDNGNWRGGDNRAWDRGWRSNNRYDWSSYRSRNRSVFQAGRYYSPYQNYSYRRVGIGLSLGSLFYGSRYWIDDPYAYRLPEVYGPYRWVRYYDDVLLVDTYTGEVVDAIYDFFW